MSICFGLLQTNWQKKISLLKAFFRRNKELNPWRQGGCSLIKNAGNHCTNSKLRYIICPPDGITKLKNGCNCLWHAVACSVYCPLLAGLPYSSSAEGENSWEDVQYKDILISLQGSWFWPASSLGRRSSTEPLWHNQGLWKLWHKLDFVSHRPETTTSLRSRSLVSAFFLRNSAAVQCTRKTMGLALLLACGVF